MEPESKLPRVDPKTGRQLPKSPGRPRKKHGRKALFSAEAAAQILVLVRAGNYPETAASFAGVSVQTFREWVRDGAKGRTDELEKFTRDLTAAEAAAEVAAVEQFRRSPKEARRFLERRFAKRWGPKAELHLGDTAGEPLTVNLLWSSTKGPRA